MSEFDLGRFVRGYGVAVIDSLIDVLRVIKREDLDLDVVYEELHKASLSKHETIAKNKRAFYKEHGVPEPHVKIIDKFAWVRDGVCPLCGATVWRHFYCGEGRRLAGVKACRMCEDHPHIATQEDREGTCEFEEYID